MDMHLRGVVRKLRASQQLPGRWVSFLSVYTASGPATKRKYPVVGIGKRDPQQPGLLMPNPFLWRRTGGTGIRGGPRPSPGSANYDKRRDVLLFRGACGPGGHERLKLMRLGTLNGAVDAGWTSVDGYTDLETCVADLSNQLGAKRRRKETASCRRACRWSTTATTATCCTCPAAPRAATRAICSTCGPTGPWS